MKTRHLWILCGFVVLGLSTTLASPVAELARHLGGQVSLPSAPIDRDTPPAIGSREIDTETILAFAPFGAAARSEVAAMTQSVPPPNIRLQGILVSNVEADSRALVSVAGQATFFKVGDMLVENAVLTAIEDDAILVTLNDRIHRYGFGGILDPETAHSPEFGTSDALSQQSASDRLGSLLVPGRGSLDLREAPPPETTADYVALWRKRIIDDPISVLDTIGLVPSAQGYTVSQNPNIGVTLAGLKPGDLVTRVNGQAVGNPDRDRAFYDEIAASGHARVEVVRGGEQLLMSFPLR